MRVGLVGLGRMGSAILPHLVRGCSSVTVWNRSPAKTNEAAGMGARVAPSLVELVEASDIVLVAAARWALLAGGRLILMPRFSASAMAEALRSGVTVAGTVPTMLRSLPTHTPIAAPALRMLLTGGEPFGAALAGRMAAALPRARIFDLYGCTETGSCDFCLAVLGQHAIGTIGAPTEHVAFKIATESGRPAEPGESGELWIRTPYGMLGYFDDPGATAAAFS